MPTKQPKQPALEEAKRQVKENKTPYQTKEEKSAGQRQTK